MVVGALGGALLGAPTASGACTSFDKAEAFQGTSGTSFRATISRSDTSGDTTTVSLDRSASDLRVDLNVKGSSSVSTFFNGRLTGGAVSVNDHYTYATSSETIIGSQSASGPTDAEGSGAQLIRVPGTCNYVLWLEWATYTTETGQWPDPPDSNPSVFGVAHTPPRPIPADLNLSGTATVTAHYDAPHGYLPWYEIGSDSYGQQFDELYRCYPSSCGPSDEPEGTATITWNLSPLKSNCVVPKLKGDTVAQATTALHKANCTVGKVTSKRSATMPKGRVISSSPAAGQKLKVGAKVDLVISGPPCVVPHLIGDFASDAPSLLQAARCTQGKVTKKYSASVAKGKIISTSPSAGSKLYYGAPVAITVSLGPPYCSVPKFLPGNTLAKAMSLLHNGNNFCTIGTIIHQASSKFAKGTVITSNPKPGKKKLPAGTVVDLTLSSGP
jgi:beta-lactam-binding protein with PASTA domain